MNQFSYCKSDRVLASDALVASGRDSVCGACRVVWNGGHVDRRTRHGRAGVGFPSVEIPKLDAVPRWPGRGKPGVRARTALG